MIDLNRKVGTLLDLLEDIRHNMKKMGKNLHEYHLNTDLEDCVECQIYTDVEKWIDILHNEQMLAYRRLKVETKPADERAE